MNPKIRKIDEETAKNNAKIAKLQERNRELAHQRMEIENTDIIGLVRSVGLTPDQLAALIRGAKPTQQERRDPAQEEHAHAED
ncbi:MAG: DUF4315 family protein [Clostridia bacterium]|nr:DUF4315 family protein [Clostridia bacterium]